MTKLWIYRLISKQQDVNHLQVNDHRSWSLTPLRVCLHYYKEKSLKIYLLHGTLTRVATRRTSYANPQMFPETLCQVHEVCIQEAF